MYVASAKDRLLDLWVMSEDFYVGDAYVSDDEIIHETWQLCRANGESLAEVDFGSNGEIICFRSTNYNHTKSWTPSTDLDHFKAFINDINSNYSIVTRPNDVVEVEILKEVVGCSALGDTKVRQVAIGQFNFDLMSGCFTERYEQDQPKDKVATEDNTRRRRKQSPNRPRRTRP